MERNTTLERNMIYVTGKHMERIRLRNPMGMFAHFDLFIYPNEINKILIETDNETVKTYIEYASRGINEYFNTLKEKEIGTNGFMINIQNNKFHPVDSKPLCYEITIIETLNKLFSSKSVYREIKKPILRTDRYSFHKHEKFQNRDYSDYNSLHLESQGLYFDRTILLNANYELKLENASIKALIRSSNSSYYSRKRLIQLWFHKECFHEETRLKIYEIIRLLEKDINTKKRNLGDLTIFLSKDLNDFDGLVEFEWAMRNLLNNETAILQYEESSR